MPEQVNFDSPGYITLGPFVASKMTWLQPEGRTITGPPTITLYACIRCGAIVPQLAEAGRLTHDQFHRDLFAAGMGEL